MQASTTADSLDDRVKSAYNSGNRAFTHDAVAHATPPVGLRGQRWREAAAADSDAGGGVGLQRSVVNRHDDGPRSEPRHSPAAAKTCAGYAGSSGILVRIMVSGPLFYRHAPGLPDGEGENEIGCRCLSSLSRHRISPVGPKIPSTEAMKTARAGPFTGRQTSWGPGTKGPIEAGDQTQPDRIIASNKDDRNGRRGRLGGESRRGYRRSRRSE
jgi:hypothetical protein